MNKFVFCSVFVVLALSMAFPAHADMSVIYNKTDQVKKVDPEASCKNTCGGEVINKYSLPGFTQDVTGSNGKPSRPKLPSSPSIIENKIKRCVAKCMREAK